MKSIEIGDGIVVKVLPGLSHLLSILDRGDCMEIVLSVNEAIELADYINLWIKERNEA